VNIQAAKQHHAKVGAALSKNDAQTAMHHIGHMMQALKAGPSAPAAAVGAPSAPAGIPNAPQAPQPSGDSTVSNGNWIAGATSNKGALHKKLGVPEGEKIPAKKLAGAEKSSNPAERKEANLARTLKSFNHSKK
jgi:hypothetical protein